MLSNDGANTEESGAGNVAQCVRACLAGTRQAVVIQSLCSGGGEEKRREVLEDQVGTAVNFSNLVKEVV